MNRIRLIERLTHTNNLELFINWSYGMRQFFWALPFFFFICSYYGIAYWVGVKTFDAPLLIGLSIQEASLLLSERLLNIRILDEKDHGDSAPGTILDQIPRQGQKIKAHQSMFLVVSKLPKKIFVPDLRGLFLQVAQEILREQKISFKNFNIASSCTVDTVVGQWPIPGRTFDESKMILYVSEGQKNRGALFPDFVGQPLSYVQESIIDMDHAISVNYDRMQSVNDACSNMSLKIVSQKPLPGTIVFFDKPLHVRFAVA